MSALAVFALAATAVGAADPRAEVLRVAVTSSDRTASAEFRSDVEGAIAVALGAERCLPARIDPSLRRDPEAPETLRLELDLTQLDEKLSYDRSLAEHAGAQDPGVSLQMTGSFSVRVRWALRRLDGTEPIEQRTFAVNRTARPMILGEDALATARQQAMRVIVEQVTRRMCKPAIRKRIEATAVAR